MSDLFGRVKDRVRSRSRHRKTSSWHPSANSRTYTSDHEMPNGGHISKASSTYDDDAAAPAPFVARVSLDNTAFHVHSQYGRRIGGQSMKISEEQRGREAQALRDILISRQNNEDEKSVIQTLAGTMVPDRESSRRSKSKSISQSKSRHKRYSSEPIPKTGQQAVLPDHQSRESQESQNKPSSRPDSNHSRNFSRPMSGTTQQDAVPPLPEGQVPAHDQAKTQTIPSEPTQAVLPVLQNRPQKPEVKPPRTPVKNQNRSVPVADGKTAHLGMYNSQVDVPERSAARENGLADLNATRERALAQLGHHEVSSPNVRLPNGFGLKEGQNTQVTESWRPAVTHENIIKQRTEIVREEITRTIHVHHYYTLLQPVKVVEILPPKHFVIDPRTGWKIEIPEPEGWIMPESMRPKQPDTSSIKGWTRHYLVNEEHPSGVPESPPLKRELNYSDLRERARTSSEH